MSLALTTAEITTIFTDGVQKHAGRMTEVYDDGRRLFMRSLLPHRGDVRPHDRMEGGLALSANDDEICLHPYLYRQVCRNGAIMAQSVAACHVELTEFATADDVTCSLEEAIDRCSEKEVFAENLRMVRAAVHSNVLHALNAAPMLAQAQDKILSREILEIMDRFLKDRDRTQFSLMNAITSLARDTRDPVQKWRLEELGGDVGAMLLPVQPEDDDACQIAIDDSVTLA
ncbi:MAG: hypothetical protein ACR2NM_08480 [Bythopirellula sp.]